MDWRWWPGQRPQELELFAEGKGSPGREGPFWGPRWCGPPVSKAPSPRPAWENSGCATPQVRHPLGSAATFRPRRVGWPENPGERVGPIANSRSGREERAGSSRRSRRRLPAPRRAALTASSLRVAVSRVPPRSARVLTLAGPGRRLPERAGPSPGKPSPPPRPPRGRGPNPTIGSRAQGLRASRRPAAPPAPAAGRGSRVRSARAGSGVAPSRGGESNFSFAPPWLPQSLGDLWEREGIGPAWTPFGGRPGATLPYIFLQITDFLDVSSDVAHNHRRESIRISIVRMQKMGIGYLRRLAQDL